MSDQFTERLSKYLDGELTGPEWMAFEAHLRECEACAHTLSELRRVTHQARRLADRAPATDLWPGIAARIGATVRTPASETDVVHLPARPAARAPRRWSFSLPQLVAAGLALVTLAGGGVWLAQTALRGSGGPVTLWGPSPLPPMPPEIPAVARPAERSYDAAVQDLAAVLEAGRDRLDTATVRVLEQNLRTIDQAIDQAERAVAADPANAYLNSHLLRTMRRKLDLLRQAAAIAQSVS